MPFFQAGDDLLRSKDLDQNSYDSGDWFNKIDWSGRGANWGIGLPIASQNQGQWPLMQPLLSNGAYAPQPQDVSFSGAAFQEFMQIRYSSNLFRMSTLKEIQQNLDLLERESQRGQHRARCQRTIDPIKSPPRSHKGSR